MYEWCISDYTVNITNPVGPSMTNLYYQCRTERESTFKNNATELGGCASFGFEAGGGKVRIGSLELGRLESDRCYMGSRVCQGSVQVNQNICLSFDPQTKTCLTCESGNGVPGDRSGCFILTVKTLLLTCQGRWEQVAASALSAWRTPLSTSWLNSSASSLGGGPSRRAWWCVSGPAPTCTGQAPRFMLRTGTGATQK